MNIGGDPGRDDYGLPPVDVQVPDDARELDRDVQAYYRELKAQRRRRLARRLCSPLARDGMVLPVLAGCLALTLLAGTLLTVFTAGQEPGVSGTLGAAAQGHTSLSQAGQGSAGQSQPAQNQPAQNHPAQNHPAQGHAARPGSQSASLLPDTLVQVGGRAQSLHAIPGTVLVLALVPPGCRCLPHLRQLKGQAGRARVAMYLVGGKGVGLATLSRRVGLDAAHTVADPRGSLPPTYRPATLTAVLVRADRSVARMVPDNGQGFRLLGQLRSLSAALP